jgi:hypothetical protein
MNGRKWPSPSSNLIVFVAGLISLQLTDPALFKLHWRVKLLPFKEIP